jgi:hypothetical protein
MNAPLEITGGAQIGWVNATWPFAKLSASGQEISVGGMLIGRYRFSPEQVAALEPHGLIPVLGKGVRIVHTVHDYPEKIIFWCFGSPMHLIERITALGFQPRGSRAQLPQRHGIAFRWSFVVLVILIWNALFLLDGYVPWKAPKGPGVFTIAAIGLLFLAALGLNFARTFQAIALKPGRSIGEVRSVALLVLAVSAIMLLVFSAHYVAG